jgi:hypothetical protein
MAQKKAAIIDFNHRFSNGARCMPFDVAIERYKKAGVIVSTGL